MQFVPLNSDSAYKTTVSLDGYDVVIRVRRNFVSGTWAIDVSCDTVGLKINGLALVTGNDILHGQGIQELGGLILVDYQGNDDPTIEGLGNRWKLVYLTNEELLELE
jgi:hypothetical protein